MKNQLLSILIVGMTLGTAWAIRGHFGHEQGAAWAGGIGALALVVASKRKDWYSRMLTIALSSAVGWGAGGMISYGIVVGYGRSDNFPNVFYGLSMLFVIGGLFGLLGGGLTGLSLESSKEKRVNWAGLIAEMVAGGLIVYGLFISELKYLMTPPRSEAWAICLGSGLALVWYMMRNKYVSSLRVAIYSALGAGFGFAFGNFLQTLGNVLEIDFNMWNVMEYSIGFFGGSALAYSIYSSQWPKDVEEPKQWESKTAFFFVFIFIPLIVFIQSLEYGTLIKKIENISENIAMITSSVSAGIMIVAAIISWLRINKSKFCFTRNDTWFIFVIYFSVYILLSYIVKGVFDGVIHLNIHLYVLNLIVILLLIKKQYNPFPIHATSEIETRRLIQYAAGIIIVLIFLAFISINIHGEMGGAHDRFPIHQQKINK